MPRRVRPTWILSCLFLFGVAVCAARADEDGETFEIRLDRPSKVGEKYGVSSLVATKTVSKLTTEGEAEPRTVRDSVGINLEGEIEVLAVTPRGAELKVACTVSKCTVTDGGETHDVIPAGKVILAEWKDDKTAYAVKLNGDKTAPIPERLAGLLDDVLRISNPQDEGNDAVFGTKEKQKVGATWPVNAEAAVKELEREGMKVAAEDVSGSTRLVEKTKAGGVDCLKIETKFKAKNASGAGKGPAKEMTLEKGELSVSVTSVMPLDPALPPLSDSGALKVKSLLKGKNPDGKAMTVEVDMDRSAETTFSPAGK
jgi:hypothetical protein